METLDQEFEQAANAVQNLKVKPALNILLQLYSLYKQAKKGDVQGPQPWAFEASARAKWDAWNSKKGLSKGEAKKQYITLVNKLLNSDNSEMKE